MTLEVSRPQRIQLLEADSVSSLTTGLKVRTENVLDETVFVVAKEDYRALCERLFNAGFDFPSSLTGVDMEWGLGVVLHVQQLESKRKATVRVYTAYDEPRLPTVSDLWGGVDWHEREAYDLVGIHFEGHHDLRRILLEDHWTIHPLQRKYNTRGYLLPQWTPKPWPSPAPWEEGFTPFAAAAPAPAKAAPPTSTAAASSPATPASVAAETKAAATDGAPVAPATASADAAAEPPKKVAKKWVPKTPAADAAPSSTPTQPAPVESPAPVAEAPRVEAAPAPSSQPETPAPSSDAPAATDAPEEKPRSPKIKRWEPKS